MKVPELRYRFKQQTEKCYHKFFFTHLFLFKKIDVNSDLKTQKKTMGLCLCGEEFDDRRQFRQVPFPNGGREHDHVPPTFHHPHFRQLSQQQQQQFQNEPFEDNSHGQHVDPRSPYGASKSISGENTRISGTHYQNGGSSIRREPGQVPGPRPGDGPGIDYANAPIDMQRTEVYRQGNEKQAVILKTPRGNTGRGGTPRSGRKSGGGGRSTPRVGGGAQQQQNSVYDDEDEDGDDDEMILICADCYCDVMDEHTPSQCPVTGKMHV